MVKFLLFIFSFAFSTFATLTPKQDVVLTKHTTAFSNAEDSVANVLLEKEWKAELNRLMVKHRIKLSCNGCSSIVFEAEISTNETGEVLDIRFLRERICTGKKGTALKQEMLQFLQKNTYARKAVRYNIRAGKSLKC